MWSFKGIEDDVEILLCCAGLRGSVACFCALGSQNTPGTACSSTHVGSAVCHGGCDLMHWWEGLHLDHCTQLSSTKSPNDWKLPLVIDWLASFLCSLITRGSPSGLPEAILVHSRLAVPALRLICEHMTLCVWVLHFAETQTFCHSWHTVESRHKPARLGAWSRLACVTGL